MISITLMGRTKENYYLTLGREDYYLSGGEPPGRWMGEGIKHLELSGIVEKEHLRNLARGFHPTTQQKLVQNAGQENRRPGWDLTFSAPKTVSVIWSQADPETRKIIQRCHADAVEKTLAYIEESAVTRCGKDGIHKQPAQLIAATFEHGTSRAADPQLHTHALVMNAGIREDGTTGAIESKSFYYNKMLYGAIYRAELARGLQQQLGLQAQKVRTWFEIKGVSQPLVEEFSKRRQAIENYLRNNGQSSARAAEVAALKTREVKGHLARASLFKEWQKVGEQFGYKPPPQRFIQRSPDLMKAAASKAALAELMEQNAHFTERDLLRQTAIEAPEHGLGLEDIKKAASDRLSSPEIVYLGPDKKGEVRYTTQEMLAIEQQMLAQAHASHHHTSHKVSDRSQKKAMRNRSLKAEQVAALKHITDPHGKIKIISGMAGTGKTYLLNAARETWEREGYKVIGAALAGKAAAGLEQGADIKSSTLHSLLGTIDKGYLIPDRQSIIVVDEAGMVGTRQMAKLIDVSARTGAKLILVGDAKQLQAIGPGGAFKKLGERLGYAQLKHITRQREDWARQAVHRMAEGKARDVLLEYNNRNQLYIADHPGAAVDKLIKDWQRQGIQRPKDHLILAGLREDVRTLNRMAQAARYDAGKLSAKGLHVRTTTFYAGDRIVFAQNSHKEGIKNGQFGTIRKIKNRTMIVQTDDDRRKVINTDIYRNIMLGYASTTHKAQGETRDHVYVLIGGSMQDTELSYVQLSRAKGITRLYAEPLEDENDTINQLIKDMSRSRQKTMAVHHHQREKTSAFEM